MGFKDRLKRSATVFFALLVPTAAYMGYGASYPFEMPPSGQPELLLADTDLEAPTAMAFDSQNRPYMINNRNPEDFGLIRTLRGGEWVTLSMRSVLPAGAQPNDRVLQAHGKIVLDDADGLYTMVRGGTLVYSSDSGATFQSYPVKGSLEVRTSPNQTIETPAIQVITNLRYVDRARTRQNQMAWWAKRGTLSVLIPTKTVGGLDLGEPILITEKLGAGGGGGHSGGTSFAVTRDGKTHVVYAEAPENPRYGGNPIYIATIDRETREVVARQYLADASPIKSDVHTSPTITIDGNGHLHVLTGSHGQPFYYTRSLEPNDITGGWTEPKQLAGRQCYASLVCDRDDRLHSVYRNWIPHASLGYSYADPLSWNWRGPETLVHGANQKGVKEYGIFYHRLFIDRTSNLYVHFTFLEFETRTEGVYPEALVVSKDGGETWALADKQSLVNAVGY